MTFVKRLLKFVTIMTALVAVMAGSLALAAPQVRNFVSAHKSDHEQIGLKPLAERSYIYDSKGNEQGVMTNRDNPQNRSQVSLDQIPDSVKRSVVAIEDQHFFEHKGINIRSIARAVDANLESGEVSQGGSTITQQVVKNSLVGDEQSFSRKLREAFLAVELEKQMSKDDILEYYLNSVYLGGGAYGVQAASEFYFKKDVSEVNWAEGALLAALIRSPNQYNPFRAPKRAAERRTLAFKRLVAAGVMEPDHVAYWEQVPLPTDPNRISVPYDYFLTVVTDELLADPKYGLGTTEDARNRTVYEGGIKVFTTFDPDLQLAAAVARNETVPGNKGDGTFDVVNPKTGETTFGTQAIVSVEPSSGAVRAMIGGPGFDKWKLNLATSTRPPGSTMKAFVAAALFEDGAVPNDSLGRGSCTFKDPGTGEDKRLTGRRGTIISMVASSSNCGFMALGQIATVERVAEIANLAGVKSDLYLHDPITGEPTSPPQNLPLGTMDVSPLEMASAYATFANDGMYNEPYYIDRIEDRTGRVLYQHQSQPTRVLNRQTARMVTEVLENNVEYGTGQRAQIVNGQPAAGKTGTTNESTDVWFVGYTPQLATAIWMGVPAGAISLSLNRDLAGATGGRFPAATWGRYYSLAFNGKFTENFLPTELTRRGKRLSSSGSSSSPSSGGRRQPRRRPTTPSGGGGGRATPSTVAPAPPSAPAPTPVAPATDPTPVTDPPATQPPAPGTPPVDNAED